jgi:hypothetical protein
VQGVVSESQHFRVRASAVAGSTGLIKKGMPCWNGDGPDFQQAARSMHAGGLFVCMCDGSVRWISDFIEVGIIYGNPPALWACGTSSIFPTMASHWISENTNHDDLPV